jgi:hypothetical protein
MARASVIFARSREPTRTLSLWKVRSSLWQQLQYQRYSRTGPSCRKLRARCRKTWHVGRSSPSWQRMRKTHRDACAGARNQSTFGTEAKAFVRLTRQARLKLNNGSLREFTIMDHPNPNPRLFCAICSKQVDLLSAVRDGYGKTVHRECHDFLYAVRTDDEPSAA